MPEKDKWRWEDLDSVFDENFVANAEFKEGDWKERACEHKDKAREAKRAARPARPSRPFPDRSDHPVSSRPPLTGAKRRNRVLVIAGVVALLAIGFALDVRRGTPTDPETSTTTTSAVATTVTNPLTSQAPTTTASSTPPSSAVAPSSSAPPPSTATASVGGVGVAEPRPG
ncbi:MAG: hypothetical protein HYX32_06155 [Actinobacteria bacterium]|nr:hypothetical protein [Actinomycetota bacterium]